MCDWLGSLGTWFIGVVATVIAWKQFKIEKYKNMPDLFKFCELDTLAMVEIYRRLLSL